MNGEPVDEKTFPSWRWFLTARGLPVLVGILALLASVTFNIHQVVATTGEIRKDFEPAGSFRTGELMDAIVEQSQWDPEADPIPTLRVVSDFAAYGAFSHPEKFERYLEVMRRRADNGLNLVSCVFLEERRRRDVFELQFKDFDALIKTAPFRAKLDAYMASGYGRRALRDLSLEDKALRPELLTFEEFVELGITVDNLIIEDLRQWGIQVKFYPHLLTVHAWSGRRDEALMAIVDFEGVVDEAGFIARRNIAENVQKIFEIVEKGSKP